MTVSVDLLPGFSFVVFLPEISKSCSSLPLFVTVNVTPPFAAEVFGRVNSSSVGLAAVRVMPRRVGRGERSGRPEVRTLTWGRAPP